MKAWAIGINPGGGHCWRSSEIMITPDALGDVTRI